jgi:hypothetical protein
MNKILIGDLVYFAEGSKVYSGRVAGKQKNNYLLLLDSQTGLGTPADKDNFARQFLKIPDSKSIHWIVEKQISSIERGSLQDYFDIVEQTSLNISSEWKNKIDNGISAAFSSGNPEDLRTVLLDCFKANNFPQEISSRLELISSSDLSEVLKEIKALEQDLNNFILEENKKSLTNSAVEFNIRNEPTPSKKEKQVMDKPGVTEMIKADSVDAGYRIASKQSTKAVKHAITNVMRNKGSKKSHVNAMADFLGSELGEAFISSGLGFALNFMPGMSDPRIQRLAKEFRVEGMASAGNLVADAATQYLLPAITETLASIPEEKTQLQVEEPEAEEEELEVAVSPKTKARA